MIDTFEEICLVKKGTILEVIRDDKNKIGGWLNRQSQIPQENINSENKNVMEWEKAVFILLWNARVKILNSVLNTSPSMKKLAVYYNNGLNQSIEENNNETIANNYLLREILKESVKPEILDLAYIYRKIITNEKIRKEPAPVVDTLIPLFQIIPDFVF